MGGRMPRTEDIVFIEGQIAEMNAAQKALSDEFAAYAAKAAQQIEKVLDDAGVREIVLAIEQARAKRQSDDQAKVNALVAKVQELERIKSFLEARERDDARKVPATVQPAAPEIEDLIDGTKFLGDCE